MSGSNWADRPRGFLTEADREFLAGERDLDGQAERNARERIRTRVQHALYDMMMVWAYLQPRDLAQVVTPEDKTERIAMRKALQDTIAVCIRAMDHADDDKPLRISAAIGQAGAVDDTIPTEFLIEYPDAGQQKKESPPEDRDDQTSVSKNDDERLGIERPQRIHWDERPTVTPWADQDVINKTDMTLQRILEEDYLNFGYIIHELLIENENIDPEAIASAYLDSSKEDRSVEHLARQIDREREAKKDLERPIFHYPLYRRHSGSGEAQEDTPFNEVVFAPWDEHREIGGPSDYFDKYSPD